MRRDRFTFHRYLRGLSIENDEHFWQHRNLKSKIESVFLRVKECVVSHHRNVASNGKLRNSIIIVNSFDDLFIRLNPMTYFQFRVSLSIYLVEKEMSFVTTIHKTCIIESNKRDVIYGRPFNRIREQVTFHCNRDTLQQTRPK